MKLLHHVILYGLLIFKMIITITIGMMDLTGAPTSQFKLEDPELGTLKNIGIPVKLSLTPGRIRKRAPDLGEHTQEILQELGYSSEEVESLRSRGGIW